MTGSTLSPRASGLSPARPRLRIAQPYEFDMSEQVALVSRKAGIDLIGWQLEMMRDWTAVDGDGRFVHNRCGASVPRQQGKSVDGIAWCTALAPVMGYKVLWTDHNYSTTCEMLSRFQKIFGSRRNDPMAGFPMFNKRLAGVNNKTAQEAFEFKGGGVLAFSTRTKSAALGYSFDVVVYDEAQELRGEHVQAILPTTTSGAMGNPQALFLGTPTRAGSTAEVFQGMHDEAWSDPGDDMCWTEYGVGEIGDVSDEARWERVLPSLGTLSNHEAIRTGLRTMDELAFAQEYLGYWLPKAADAVISPDEWKACLVSKADAPKEGGRVAYGVKFSPDGSHVALAAARLLEDGRAHVELVAQEPTSKGVGWLAAWLAERPGRACSAAIDGLSGSDALVDAMGRTPKGYVIRPTSGEVIAAASMMLDAIREKRLTHIDDPALGLSATSSGRRRIGSRGGWGFDGENATLIEAASLALLAAKRSKRRPGRKIRIG